jgi:ABC-type multidrug transport system ATPase subunit
MQRWSVTGNSILIEARGSETVKAVDGIDMEIRAAEMVSIMGPSGSGKTTLIHLLSSLDSPTEGNLSINGKPVPVALTIVCKVLIIVSVNVIQDFTNPKLVFWGASPRSVCRWQEGP